MFPYRQKIVETFGSCRFHQVHTAKMVLAFSLKAQGMAYAQIKKPKNSLKSHTEIDIHISILVSVLPPWKEYVSVLCTSDNPGGFYYIQNSKEKRE